MMRRVKVLIVDDEKIVVKAYAIELKRIGCEVFLSSSGQEAVDIAKKEKLDIAITDLLMPEVNGVEVCKRIKEINPKTEVVLMSASCDEVQKYLIKFIEAGGRKEWLEKPPREDELSNTIEKIIKELGDI